MRRGSRVRRRAVDVSRVSLCWQVQGLQQALDAANRTISQLSQVNADTVGEAERIVDASHRASVLHKEAEARWQAELQSTHVLLAGERRRVGELERALAEEKRATAAAVTREQALASRVEALGEQVASERRRADEVGPAPGSQHTFVVVACPGPLAASLDEPVLPTHAHTCTQLTHS
jgi:hypothetical protein